MCGGLGHCIDFYVWKGLQVVRSWPKYTYQRTERQAVRRKVFQDAVIEYQKLDEKEKQHWREQAYGTYMSGYEKFLKTYLESH